MFISVFLFFQNSANDNDVDSNTNNEDRIYHGTDDLESSSEYEFDISDDGCDLQPQPKHRSIRGGGFRRCGRVGAPGRRADGVRGGDVHAVPRVANQPVTLGEITDFENPNVSRK